MPSRCAPDPAAPERRVPGRRLRIGSCPAELPGSTRWRRSFEPATTAPRSRAIRRTVLYLDVAKTGRAHGTAARLRRRMARYRGARRRHGSRARARRAIDILVDLTGHTGRPPSAGLRPQAARAVQVTWNGYANTTGMAAMDSRFAAATRTPRPGPPTAGTRSASCACRTSTWRSSRRNALRR